MEPQIMNRILVPGVFDVFHIGHLNYLKNAAKIEGYVIVAVQEDRAVEKAKGTAMVTPLHERMALIEELRFVNEVVSYIDVYQGPLLKSLAINVFACGEEYGNDIRFPDQVKTLEYCSTNNIKVVRIPRTAHVSSTNIREKLRLFWASRAAKEKDLPAGVTTLGSFGGDQQKIDNETQKEIELILESTSMPNTLSIADIACGDGRLLSELAIHFKETVGIDFIEELLEIAKRKTQNLKSKPRFVVCDATTFIEDKLFDVFLLSGITPYLDDEQLATMLSNINKMSKKSTKCLVRTSISLGKRINVINQFSVELQTTYTAFYRTVAETESIFLEHGWKCQERFQLYQHRPDTAVWWFEFHQKPL